MQLKESLEIIDAEWSDVIVSVTQLPTTEPDFKWEYAMESLSEEKTLFRPVSNNIDNNS